MLINRTYFIGELNVPNAQVPDSPDSEVLDMFLSKYEPEFLEKLLGYSLYQALLTGLVQDPIASKWIALLNGTTYTSNTKTKRWRGIVSTPGTVIDSSMLVSSPFAILVDGPGEYDPESAQSDLIIPEGLRGQAFTFEQRAAGLLDEGVDYVISEDGEKLTLLNGIEFNSGGRFFFEFNSIALNTVAGTSKSSMIANYVYYWFTKDAYTQTASMGEVKTVTENAISVAPGLKMIRAWNEMSEWIDEMVSYINSGHYEYPEWQDQDVRCMLNTFQKINQFNI